MISRCKKKKDPANRCNTNHAFSDTESHRYSDCSLFFAVSAETSGCVWLRFFEFLRMKKGRENGAQQKLSKRISVKELNVAEFRLLKYDQRKSFRAVFDGVEQGKRQTNAICGRKILQLNPFVHFGLLRVGGRIENAVAPFEARRPALLPGGSEFARLVIGYHHDLVGHAGVNHTFTSLR